MEYMKNYSYKTRNLLNYLIDRFKELEKVCLTR